MTLAILCSGQGPQHPRMFALTGDAQAAVELFAHAATLLGGRDPRTLVHTATDDALHENRLGQVLCTLQALAATAALRDAWPRRPLVAGYSVGEVAAWGVAGVVDATVTLDLVAQRAEAMDAASTVGDGLLFVRGLSRATVDALCERHDAAVAIVNPDGAFVLGAGGATLDHLGEEAQRMGAARVVRLGVHVASHTRRLASASAAFRAVLERTAVSPGAGARLFSGIDGSPVLDVHAGVDKLAAQVSQTVEWAACLQGCVEAGATAFFELGPGQALRDMAASAYPEIPARSLEEFRTLKGAGEWLGRVLS